MSVSWKGTSDCVSVHSVGEAVVRSRVSQQALVPLTDTYDAL